MKLRVVLAAMMLLLLPLRLHAAEVLRVAYEDKALPPYYMGTGATVDSSAPGISVELVRQVGAKLGLDVQIVRMPWTRCLNSLQSGEVDAIFNASFNPERQQHGVYPMANGKPDGSRRIATVAYSLYRVKGSPVGWNGKAVTGLTGPVGAPAGYSIIEDLRKMGIAVEDAPDSLANFRKLAASRIGAVATLDVAGDALMASGGFPQVEKVSPPLVVKDYFVMFSHQFTERNRPLAERFWATLAETRDREAAALEAKYLGHGTGR